MAEKKARHRQPNLALRLAREARGWTQQEVAEKIGAPYQFMMNRWENGVVAPNPLYRERLARLFGQTAEELGLLPAQKVQASQGLYDPAIPLPFANDRALIGREQLLAEVREKLDAEQGQARVALSGLPGVGKTTLAVALANDPAVRERFSDGVLWLGLGPQPNLTALLSRWGSLLGISQDEAAGLKNQESWLQWLHNSLGTRQMLLVIDDVWSIQDTLTCLVGGPRCSYLLTTRLLDVALQFAGQRVVRVPELSQEESLNLLYQLAPAIVQAEEEAVRDLAQTTGGLPLALTLLGQHLLVQTGQQTGGRLQRTLARLQGFEERIRLQQPQAGLQRDYRLPDGSALSLQAIIGLSETGLTEQARQMLSSLAVFPAKPTSFPEEAALAVAQESVESLDSLVDAGLVEYIGDGRYTLHQTIADYARARAHDTAAEIRMARYFSDLVVKGGNDFHWLEQETASVLQALQQARDHGLHAEFIQGTLASVPFLQNRAQHQLIAQYLEIAEQLARTDQQPAILLNVLQTSGNVALWLGDYERAERAYQEGWELARYNEEPLQICQFLLYLGRLVGRQGDYTRAERFFQDGLALARQIPDHECACNLLHGLGVLAAERGIYAQANEFFGESLILARQISSEELICKSLNNLAAIAAELAQFEQAEAYWQEVLPIVRERQWKHLLSMTMVNLGTIMQRQRKWALAQVYFEESLALDRELANRERLCQTLEGLVTLLRQQGAYEQAWSYLQEGLELARQMRHRRMLGELLLETGELCLQTSRIAQAEKAFRETLEEMPEGQYSLEMGVSYGLARVAAAKGNIDEARRLGHACLSQFSTSSYHRLAEVQIWLDELI